MLCTLLKLGFLLPLTNCVLQICNHTRSTQRFFSFLFHSLVISFSSFLNKRLSLHEWLQILYRQNVTIFHESLCNSGSRVNEQFEMRFFVKNLLPLFYCEMKFRSIRCGLSGRCENDGYRLTSNTVF